jgi:FkbM family methyltransferase
LVNQKYKNFLNLNLDKNSLVIDIGANIGIISKIFEDLYDCKIEAYEPGKYAYLELKKRFKNNKKVKCFNYGISNKNYNSKIYYPNNYSLDQKKYSVGATIFNKTSNINLKNFDNIKILSIQNIIKKHRFIDLIKIDAEGAEYNILNYLIKSKKKIGKVICELHGNPKKEKKSIFKKKYIKTKKILIKKKLLNNWFVEHY